MASPDLIKSIAKEFTDEQNLADLTLWLDDRVAAYMKNGDAESVIRVGRLRDRARATMTKLSATKPAAQPRK